jgi:hypothetical protein
MAACGKLKTCPFFSGQIAEMPAVANLLKETYCFGDKMQCARYLFVLAGIPAPSDLLPNDVERAEQLTGRR